MTVPFAKMLLEELSEKAAFVSFAPPRLSVPPPKTIDPLPRVPELVRRRVPLVMVVTPL